MFYKKNIKFILFLIFLFNFNNINNVFGLSCNTGYCNSRIVSTVTCGNPTPGNPYALYNITNITCQNSSFECKCQEGEEPLCSYDSKLNIYCGIGSSPQLLSGIDCYDVDENFLNSKKENPNVCYPITTCNNITCSIYGQCPDGVGNLCLPSGNEKCQCISSSSSSGSNQSNSKTCKDGDMVECNTRSAPNICEQTNPCTGWKICEEGKWGECRVSPFTCQTPPNSNCPGNTPSPTPTPLEPEYINLITSILGRAILPEKNTYFETGPISLEKANESLGIPNLQVQWISALNPGGRAGICSISINGSLTNFTEIYGEYGNTGRGSFLEKVTSTRIYDLYCYADYNSIRYEGKSSLIVNVLEVDLSAYPSTIIPFQKTSLITTLSGTSYGTARYFFDCNNDGIIELDTGDQWNYKYTASNLCSYNIPGIYTAKVEVWHNYGRAIATTTINVVPGNTPSPSPSTPPPPQKHLECNSSNQCVEVNGPGPNRCNISSDCGPTNFAGKCELQNGAKFCVNKRCNPAIPGDCISECKNDSDCGTNPPPSTHLECYNNSCVIVSGSGTNKCSKIGLGCQGNIREINPIFPKINPPSIFNFVKNTASIFFVR